MVIEISGNESQSQTTTPDLESQAAAEAAKIAASGGGIDWSDEDKGTQSTEAPQAGNSDEQNQTPVTGQPEDDGANKDDKTQASEGQAAEAQATDEASAEEEQQRQMQLMRQRAGLAPTKGDDNYDALETKYQESSRECHRLTDVSKAKDAMLSELGLQIIEKDDGSFGLAATQDYMTGLDLASEAKAIFDRLPKELANAFENDEAAAKVVEHITNEVHQSQMSKRPPTNATQDDVRLPSHIVDNVFNEMAAEKIGTGDDAVLMYEDMNEDDVAEMMLEGYQHPAARDFFTIAHKNPENMKWFLDSLHARVFRGRAPILAAQADAEERAKAQKEEKLKDASVETGANSDNSSATNGNNAEVDEALQIASIGNSGHWY